MRVRRLRAGEVVTAADGYGRWRTYVVHDTGRGTARLRATSDVEHEGVLRPRLTMAVSLTKGERPELVQKLTELGVDAVVFLRAARSVVRWDDERAGAAIDRLRRIAREAGRQARRARVPLIDGPIGAPDLVAMPGLVVADRDGAAVSQLAIDRDAWTVAVGPEGGFDEAERKLLVGAPRLGVGPYVLRAETAAIACAAVVTSSRVWSSLDTEREEW